MRRAAGLLLALFAGAGCSDTGDDRGAAPTGDRPVARNVLLVAIDTLRADHLGCYGYPRETTPALDALAAAGARLERALAPAPWSPPSHTTMVTGVHPFRHGVEGWAATIRPEVRLLGERLREAGLSTGVFSSHTAVSQNIGRIHEGMDEVHVHHNEEDDRTVQRALEFLDAHRATPFFAWVLLMAPHAPYHAPPPFAGRFDDAEPVVPGRTFPFGEDPFFGIGEIPTLVQVEGQHDSAYYVNRYDEEIAYADSLVGRLLERLDRLGLAEDTLVIVTSDHGESFGEHEFFSHEVQMYETLLRVPLLLRWPAGIAAGGVSAELAGLQDLVPTVLAALGLPADPRLEGRDLGAVLRGESPGHARLFSFYHGRGHVLAMATDRARKVVFDYQHRLWEAYDLVRDPGELEDRAPDALERPEYSLLRDALREHLFAPHPPQIPFEAEPEALKALRELGYVR